MVGLCRKPGPVTSPPQSGCGPRAGSEARQVFRREGSKPMSLSMPWWSPQMTGTELALVEQVLNSNYVNGGNVTEEVEQRIASLVGAKYGIGVPSGTTAIYLSLVALGV